MIREQAVRVGVHPRVAGRESVCDLRAVIAIAPQLKLAVSRIDLMRDEGFGEDEIASLLTFTTGRLVEPTSLGGEAYQPGDEYQEEGHE
jgi:hypothetical protein